MASALNGTRLGDYVLKEKIGEGGFSEVWKAEHAEIPGKYAAVKIPTDPEYASMLRSEAALQHRMRHRRIVEVETVNTSGDISYMVMEFMPRNSLRLKISFGALRPVDAIGYMKGVLEGLAYAHLKGVVHGDIKPENLLFDKWNIKISDFGCGRLTQEISSGIRVSNKATTKIIGTYDYMAPEVKRGEKPTKMSDVYSCGVVFNEMLTGDTRIKLPIKAFEPASAVVDKATEADPAKRFRSANDMSTSVYAVMEAYNKSIMPADDSDEEEDSGEEEV